MYTKAKLALCLNLAALFLITACAPTPPPLAQRLLRKDTLVAAELKPQPDILSAVNLIKPQSPEEKFFSSMTEFVKTPLQKRIFNHVLKTGFALVVIAPDALSVADKIQECVSNGKNSKDSFSALTRSKDWVAAIRLAPGLSTYDITEVCDNLTIKAEGISMSPSLLKEGENTWVYIGNISLIDSLPREQSPFLNSSHARMWQDSADFWAFIKPKQASSSSGALPTPLPAFIKGARKISEILEEASSAQEKLKDFSVPFFFSGKWSLLGGLHLSLLADCSHSSLAKCVRIENKPLQLPCSKAMSLSGVVLVPKWSSPSEKREAYDLIATSISTVFVQRIVKEAQSAQCENLDEWISKDLAECKKNLINHLDKTSSSINGTTIEFAVEKKSGGNAAPETTVWIDSKQDLGENLSSAIDFISIQSAVPKSKIYNFIESNDSSLKMCTPASAESTSGVLGLKFIGRTPSAVAFFSSTTNGWMNIESVRTEPTIPCAAYVRADFSKAKHTASTPSSENSLAFEKLLGWLGEVSLVCRDEGSGFVGLNLDSSPSKTLFR